MARRKRCSGPCGRLADPGSLARVGGRDALCPDCLLAEAEKIGLVDAGELAAHEQQKEAEAASAPPEPLPLRDEEERFAGMIERSVDGWPLRRGRLSASALGTYMRCREQFRRQYVLGERRPSGGTSLAGTGAHGAIEAALNLRIRSGQVATSKQIVDTYDAVYDDAVGRARDREGIEWGSITVSKKKVPLDEDSARRLGRGAVEAYARETLAHVDAVEVERVFALDVPGVAVPLVGLIDVAGERSVVDMKFGAQTASAVKPDWRIQAMVYGLSSRLPVDFHATSWAGKVTTPRKSPALRYAWDAYQAVLAVRLIRGVVDSILADARTLGPDAPWLGGLDHAWACNMCEFRRDCAWWNVTPSDLLI